MELLRILRDLAAVVYGAVLASLADWLNTRVALCEGRRRTTGFSGPTGLLARVLCNLARLLWRLFPKEPLPLVRSVPRPGARPCGCEKEE